MDNSTFWDWWLLVTSAGYVAILSPYFITRTLLLFFSYKTFIEQRREGYSSSWLDYAALIGQIGFPVIAFIAAWRLLNLGSLSFRLSLDWPWIIGIAIVSLALLALAFWRFASLPASQKCAHDWEVIEKRSFDWIMFAAEHGEEEASKNIYKFHPPNDYARRACLKCEVFEDNITPAIEKERARLAAAIGRRLRASKIMSDKATASAILSMPD